MAEIVYKIVPHDGGFAYSVDGAFSETFRTQALAHAAAERAAREQHIPDDPHTIVFETPDGEWHAETTSGQETVETRVED